MFIAKCIVCNTRGDQKLYYDIEFYSRPTDLMAVYALDQICPGFAQIQVNIVWMPDV